ncbi:MAG: hypothetical protein JXD18_09640 [Anaerolineae bacterium]|nr:hypothetical protein [Anaerolineae bacterium]
MAGEEHPPSWLWKGAVAALALVLAGGGLLATALGAGWGSPHAGTPPTWRADRPITLTASTSDPVQRYPLAGGSDAFSLEVVAQPVSGADFNGYGLAVGTTAFAIGGDGYTAVLATDGVAEAPRVPWQAFPHIHRGASPNRLRVTCDGHTCEFRINDELAATVDDAGQRAELALWAHWFEGPPLHVQFTQIARWDTPTSD